MRRFVAAGFVLWIVCTLLVWKLDNANAASLLPFATGRSTSSTSVTCTLPPATAGDLLVLVVELSSGGSTVTGRPSGFTAVGGVFGTDMSTKIAAGGETALTATFSTSIPVASCQAYEFAGMYSPSVSGAGVSAATATSFVLSDTATGAVATGDLFVGGMACGTANPGLSITSGSAFLVTDQASTAGFGVVKLSADAADSVTVAVTPSSTCAWVAVSFTPGAPPTTTTTAPTTTTTVPGTTTTTAPVTTTTAAGVGLDVSALCDGVIVHAPTTTATSTTTLPTTTTTQDRRCRMVVEGFAGDGLLVPVALGLVVFATLAALVISWRTRRF